MIYLLVNYLKREENAAFPPLLPVRNENKMGGAKQCGDKLIF